MTEKMRNMLPPLFIQQPRLPNSSRAVGYATTASKQASWYGINWVRKCWIRKCGASSSSRLVLSDTPSLKDTWKKASTTVWWCSYENPVKCLKFLHLHSNTQLSWPFLCRWITQNCHFGHKIRGGIESFRVENDSKSLPWLLNYCTVHSGSVENLKESTLHKVWTY